MWCFIYKAFDCLRQHDLLLAKLYAYVFDYKSLNLLMHNGQTVLEHYASKG